MLVTSEWSQRTALVTFTLEPRRSRVVLAELVVAQLLTVLTLVVAFVVGVVCTAICELVQPDLTSWAIGLGYLAGLAGHPDPHHARRVRPGDPVS